MISVNEIKLERRSVSPKIAEVSFRVDSGIFGISRGTSESNVPNESIFYSV